METQQKQRWGVGSGLKGGCWVHQYEPRLTKHNHNQNKKTKQKGEPKKAPGREGAILESPCSSGGAMEEGIGVACTEKNNEITNYETALTEYLIQII